MTQEGGVSKIRLSSGMTEEEWLEVLSHCKSTSILFSLPSDMAILARIGFLRLLKKIAEEKGKKISFLTRKKYFQEILQKEGFETFESIPEVFEACELEPWMNFTQQQIAEKNHSVAQEKPTIPFAPKVVKSIPKFSKTQIVSDQETRSPRRGVYFFCVLLCLGLLAMLWIWVTPSAEIVIRPKYSSVPITQNIILKLPEARVPDSEIHLPQVGAFRPETTISGTENFSTLDRRYEVTNAFGEITLYNLTKEEKYLLPSRLSTDEGIIVRFKNPVTIPPVKGEIPGKVVIKVEADPFFSEGKPIGDLGNLEAGTRLFFPALRKETREFYYGKVDRGPLVGGSTLTRYFLGAEDTEKAKNMLQETFAIRAQEALHQELALRSTQEKTKYVFLDDPLLLKSELQDFVPPLEPVGAEIKTFSLKGTLKLSGIAFNQKEILRILQEKMKASQDHRKKLIRVDEASLEYRVLSAEFSEKEHWIKLSVSGVGVETLDMESQNPYVQVWNETLKREIAGKTIKKARSLLINHPEVEEVLDINIRPFWKESLPQLYDQIKLKIRIE